MRRLLTLSGILVLFMLGILLGWCGGIRHAMEDSEMFIVSYEEPVSVFIELDGNIYEHKCYIG